MKPAEQLAKSASTPMTGLFAMLCGLLRAEGTGASSSAAGPGLTIARRPILILLASAGVLVGALALGAASAAASTEFGEEGVHSGQLKAPYGVAVDQVSGDVLVGEQNNHRISKFTGSGGFFEAWGWGVNEESPAEELQTCTTFCQAGKPGTGAGTYAFGGPYGVAVDNEPSSASHGDVYVVDRDNFRVEKFTAQGEFVLTFGGGVITGGATGTGDLESGSTTIKSVSTTSRAFLEGQTVTGAGIPAGTTIRRVGETGSSSAGTLTLSQPATASGAAVALTVAAGAGGVPNNERQTVTVGGTPTGGTFTLTFTSPNPDSTEATTAPIAYNAEPSGPSSVQEALEDLPNIGSGNVAVTGSAGGPYTVEFTSARYADTNVAEMTANAEGLEPPEEESVSVATAVQGHSSPEVCATASICQAGAEGTADGQFAWSRGSDIAVGPDGNVYVGDQARVQIFEPSGAWKENISLAGLSSEGPVTALAVNAAGDMFVKDREASGVHEFAPNGAEMLTQFDEGSNSIVALAVDDNSGDLYVADHEENAEFHVLKYDPAGKELARFGSKEVGFSEGMAFSDPRGVLYVPGQNTETEEYAVFVLSPPPPGPLIEPGSESGTPGLHGEATLQATINPEGNETTYHFQYITEKQYKEDGETFGAGAVATAESASIGSEFEDASAEANLPEAALVPGETYRWRVVATDSLHQTATGAVQTLEETPAALIDGPSATEVTATSATLAARIDPQGTSTSYRLEYGTSSAYEHVLAGNVGAGSTFVAISHPLQELTASTTYHYRLVTSNECIVGRTCTVDSGDRTFTTQAAGSSQFTLPDGRAWELVTPARTGAAEFELPDDALQAASDGSAIAYSVSGAPIGEEVVSNASISNNAILSRRGPDGWRTRDISQVQTVEEAEEESGRVGAGGSYKLFSPDLTAAVAEPSLGALFSPEALPGTQYLRNTSDGSYTPLLTPANVCCGITTFEAEQERQEGVFFRTTLVHVLAVTPDLRHLILYSPLGLTPDAIPTGDNSAINLYEWSDGRLQLVNILPDGKPSCLASTGTVGCTDVTGVQLAGGTEIAGAVPRAVSSDGRWVAWTRGDPYGGAHNSGNGHRSKGNLERYRGLYVRDMLAGRTVRVGGVSPVYQTMSSDGSHIYFLEAGELYQYDTASSTLTDLTAAHGLGEASAGVQPSVADLSEDGSSVYFVANGVLGDGAARGAKPGDCEPISLTVRTCNLYLLHDGGKWEAPQFIATLSSLDEHTWHDEDQFGIPHLERLTSRVSPDGRYLTFMSSMPLTGYDNVDRSPAAEGARDEEVYLYDASTRHLACVSCERSGARPAGVLGGIGLAIEAFGNPAWAPGQETPTQKHWLAGSLPGWQAIGGTGVHQPRYLSDSGRLFFQSPVALVPQDTNGREDVYQYEPPGVGGCTDASATFSAGAGGCVSLISSGTASAESVFYDASETGEDVFFTTSQRLSTADQDTGPDLWDAHACSVSSPCLTLSASPPACSSGDACKPAPTPQPEFFGPAPSSTFSGAGNPIASPPVAVKPLTRLQKLSKALARCRTRYRHSKKRRAACERTAHRHYGYAAKRSRRANATKRGGK